MLYPLEEWGKLAKKLESLPTSQVDVRGFVRIMFSGAVDVGFDKLGRVKNMAEEEGYSTLSDFMRDLVFHKNSLFKEKFFIMYKKIMENE